MQDTQILLVVDLYRSGATATLVANALPGAGAKAVYVLAAYSASQRTREIGIRLALGAQPGALKTMFVRHALALAGAGVALGLGAPMGLQGQIDAEWADSDNNRKA